jgi:signal transduction histidine kinase
VQVSEEKDPAADVPLLEGGLDLAVGVLHDLANSMGYIASNISPLKQYINDLTELVEIYGELEEGLGAEELSYLERFKSAIELPELLADLTSILEAMTLGGVRSTSLIDEMRVLLVPGARIVRRPANPMEVAQHSVQIFKERFGSKVQFNLIGDPVPDVSCPETALVRVVENLMVNAVHATADRPDALIELKVSADPSGQSVTISVSDNGVGIPPDDCARVFEPYYTTRPAGEGTGLGLAIVRKIVVDYGGKLRLDSAPGEGTRFYLTLPMLAD